MQTTPTGQSAMVSLLLLWRHGLPAFLTRTILQLHGKVEYRWRLEKYSAQPHRYPVIYTTTDWWTTCTGNAGGFSNNNPLWIADYAANIGPLPTGYAYTTFWQYADSGPNPGDADLFNGDSAGLSRMALG